MSLPVLLEKINLLNSRIDGNKYQIIKFLKQEDFKESSIKGLISIIDIPYIGSIPIESVDKDFGVWSYVYHPCKLAIAVSLKIPDCTLTMKTSILKEDGFTQSKTHNWKLANVKNSSELSKEIKEIIEKLSKLLPI